MRAQLTGRRLGIYQVQDLIGAGGIGDVRARDLVFLSPGGSKAVAEVRATAPFVFGGVRRPFAPASGSWVDYEVHGAGQPLTILSAWPGPRP